MLYFFVTDIPNRRPYVGKRSCRRQVEVFWIKLRNVSEGASGIHINSQLDCLVDTQVDTQ